MNAFTICLKLELDTQLRDVIHVFGPALTTAARFDREDEILQRVQAHLKEACCQIELARNTLARGDLS